MSRHGTRQPLHDRRTSDVGEPCGRWPLTRLALLRNRWFAKKTGGTPPSVISADQRQPCAGHERRARPCSTGIKIGGLPFDFGSQLRKLRADYRRMATVLVSPDRGFYHALGWPRPAARGQVESLNPWATPSNVVTERVHLKGCVRSGNGTLRNVALVRVRGSGRDKLRNLDGRNYLLIRFYKSRWFQVPASTDT